MPIFCCTPFPSFSSLPTIFSDLLSPSLPLIFHPYLLLYYLLLFVQSSIPILYYTLSHSSTDLSTLFAIVLFPSLPLIFHPYWLVYMNSPPLFLQSSIPSRY
jgi:hypothetical protein